MPWGMPVLAGVYLGYNEGKRCEGGNGGSASKVFGGSQRAGFELLEFPKGGEEREKEGGDW